MSRFFTLLAVTLLLGACSATAPAAVDATQFRNAQNGQVAAGCALQGFLGPLQTAQQECISAWKSKGWTPLSG